MKKESYTYTYTLQYGEAFEQYYLTASLMSRTKKAAVKAGLVVIGFGSLAIYGALSHNVIFLIIALAALIEVCALMLMPRTRAKKAAKIVEEANMTVELTIRDDGTIQFAGEESRKLAGDETACTYESVNCFVIRTDREHTYCLPRGVVPPDEKDDIRAYLKSLMRYEKA